VRSRAELPSRGSVTNKVVVLHCVPSMTQAENSPRVPGA
jgi:hypothetical protein